MKVILVILVMNFDGYTTVTLHDGYTTRRLHALAFAAEPPRPIGSVADSSAAATRATGARSKEQKRRSDGRLCSYPNVKTAIIYLCAIPGKQKRHDQDVN